MNCTEEMYDVISRRVAYETGISSDAATWNGCTRLMYTARKGHL